MLGCTTQKNTVVTRTYHNITSHYNAYFNGYESLKAGVKKIEKNVPDNYSLMLPVFKHSSTEAASSVVGEMDKAIKKASKVITMHSITVKPKRRRGEKTEAQEAFYNRKEYCNWVDDSHLMMGNAHFYKHDYFLAAQSYVYIIQQYSDMSTKYDGLVWLARTYIEQKNFRRAKELLDQIEAEKEFPKRLTNAFATTYADFYMKQKKYSDAIPMLELAIKTSRKKVERARYKYILAQINQQLGNSVEASRLYADVVRLNPNYEMAFSAKINRATSYDAGAGDSREIRKQLNKMLKDDKNIEYQDQIYYALAKINEKENNEKEAIEYYKLSAEKSMANADQQALTYMALGDIYFSRPDYILSQAYYDSCLSVLNAEHPRYENLKLLSGNLTELVGYITTVEREDSLQKVAAMDDRARNTMIDKIIEELKEEERRVKEMEQQRRMNAAMFEQDSRMNRGSSTGGGGKWYFYNPQAVALGKTQFANKWGTRKLADNWRRKNKSVVDFGLGDEEMANADSTAEDRVEDNKTREYYLQDLPLTDSAVAVSNESIKKALYKLGLAYKEKLKDYPKAIEAYKTLNKRFPGSEYELYAYYDIYSLYVLLDDQSNADKYKALIISKYPDSKYALILKNPDYLKNLAENQNKAQKFYEETYAQYKNNNYAEVISKVNQADTAFAGSELMPKFLFLRALSTGEMGDTSKVKAQLKYLLKEYPGSEVKEPASDILAVLTKGEVSEATGTEIVNEDEIVEEAEEIYSYNEKQSHFYIVIADGKQVDINRLKFNIANFNIDNYSMIDFNVSAIVLDKDVQMITVKSFDNATQAVNYFNAIKDNSQVYANINSDNYDHFVISSDNYAAFYKDKDINKYLKYFIKHYLESSGK